MSISGELIVSRYRAESITMIAGRFSQQGEPRQSVLMPENVDLGAMYAKSLEGNES